MFNSFSPNTQVGSYKQIVDVRQFRPAGDGVTDDRAVLQAAIDATPIGGTLLLESHKTYFVSLCLYVRKPMTLNCNGAIIIKSNDGTTNQNSNIRIETTMPAPVTWTETLAVGTSTLTVGAGNVSSFSVGNEVYLWLGTSALDGTLPDWSGWAVITAVGVSTVTINRSLPYAITGTTQHIYAPTQIAQDIVICNGSMTEVVTGAPVNFGNIYLHQCRRVRLEHLDMFGDGIVLDQVDGVRGEHLTIRGQNSSETGLGGWHIANSFFDNIKWSYAHDGSGVRQCIVTENRVYGLHFGVIEADMGPDGNNEFCNCGPSTHVTFGKVVLYGAAVADQGGGGGGNLIINELFIWGDIGRWDFQHVSNVTLNGTRLGAPKRFSANFSMAAMTFGSYYGIGVLPSGLYKRFFMRPHGTTTGMDIYLNDGTGNPGGTHSANLRTSANNLGLSTGVSLADNVWSALPHGSIAGSVWGGGEANNIRTLQRQLLGNYTGSGGVSIDIVIDYFPDLSVGPMYP